MVCRFTLLTHQRKILTLKPVVISLAYSAANSWCGERKLELNGTTVFLTESVFKACALHRVGANAWSVLGSNVSPYLFQQLSLLGLRFVCVGDEDKAGEEFANTFRYGCTSKDLDELSLDELYDLTNRFR